MSYRKRLAVKELSVGASAESMADKESVLKRFQRSVQRARALPCKKSRVCVDPRDRLRVNYERLVAIVYDKLSAWEIVQIARHPERPSARYLVDVMGLDFHELHGDRFFGDDPAIFVGFGRIGTVKVMFVGHDRGTSSEQKLRCNGGSARPEGYRKALDKMRLAEKFGLPIICLIDTPGAFPGIDAEERGQARAIAVNLMEMSRLKVPIICVVVGQGGSGGAVGIGVGDRMAIMQYAYFSVISPEGCAAILWRDRGKKHLAAKVLKITSEDVKRLGLVDTIVPEPMGGSHRDPATAARNLRVYLIDALNELSGVNMDLLLERRYRRLRSIGQECLIVPESHSINASGLSTTGN